MALSPTTTRTFFGWWVTGGAFVLAVFGFIWIIPIIGIVMTSIRPLAETSRGWWRIDTFTLTLSAWQRVLIVIAALLLIKPGIITDAIGFGLLAVMLGFQFFAHGARTSPKGVP